MTDFEQSFEFSISVGLYEQAAFFAQRIIESCAPSPEPAVKLAMALFHAGEYSRAHWVLSRIGRLESLEHRYLLARICLKLELYEDVLKALPITLLEVENSPLVPPALFLLGQAHEKLDEHPTAAERYQKAVDLNPAMWSAYSRLSALLGEHGVKVSGNSLASRFFAKTPAIQPFAAALHAVHSFEGPLAVSQILSGPLSQRNPLALSLVAKSHCDAGDYVKAEQLLSEVARVDPLYITSISSGSPFKETCGCCSSLELHSSVLWQLRKELELAQLSARVLQLNTKSSSSLVVVGNAFSCSRDHDTAIKFLKRATLIDPGSANAHALLGLEYKAREKLDKAQESFDKALSCDPRCVTAWWGAGCVYAAQEEWAAAYAQFQRAVAINPTSGALRTSLASSAAAMGIPEEAREGYGVALGLNPDNAFALFSAAQLEINDENLLAARSLMEKARALAPKEPAVHFLMGRVLAGQGDLSGALCAYDAALDLGGKEGKTEAHLIRASIEQLRVMAKDASGPPAATSRRAGSSSGRR